MAARVIAQIILQGSTVLVKACFSAYQQALQNAKKGGASNATRIMKLKMQPEEALQILNIEKTAMKNKQIIEQQYKKYFEINDPSKGGSFYLQSKIYRAKEALENELPKEDEPDISKKPE